MRRSSILLLIAVLASLAMVAIAQDGTVVAPASTHGLPNLKVHTPLYVFQPAVPAPNNPPASAENPGSLACIYGVTPPTSGCPRTGSPVATGGSKAIAVVEYGNNTTLQADFNAFNSYYGLPSQTLTIRCACGSCPTNDGSGWDVESALDVEYAHAMAPNAQIIVSQFCNDPLTDGSELGVAQYIVANYGAGEVSNSWGYNGGEYSSELSDDSYFTLSGVVFFASAGDSGLGPQYPSVSPNVISAGGTLVQRDSSGNLTGEACWSGSGGGISRYEPLPNWQLLLGNRIGMHRGTPDWAADASPSSGAAVYSTTYCGGWCKVGGTSLAAPLLAGILNSNGSFRNHTANDQGMTYSYLKNPGTYRRYIYDVTTGSNGSPAGVGWDQCTGLGTPRVPSAF
jgi:kumamolisin